MVWSGKNGDGGGNPGKQVPDLRLIEFRLASQQKMSTNRVLLSTTGPAYRACDLRSHTVVPVDIEQKTFGRCEFLSAYVRWKPTVEGYSTS